MGEPGKPSPGLDDYLYWQVCLSNREASGLSIDTRGGSQHHDGPDGQQWNEYQS